MVQADAQLDENDEDVDKDNKNELEVVLERKNIKEESLFGKQNNIDYDPSNKDDVSLEA